MTTHNLYAVGDAGGFFVLEERPFNPWRCPLTLASSGFVREVIGIIEAHEALTGARQRRRRAEDQETFMRLVSAVACDLAVNAMTEGGAGIHISRSNRALAGASRYANPVKTKTLRRLLDQLTHPDVALIEQELGQETANGEKRQTVVRPADRLFRMISSFMLSPADIGELPRSETIELKTAPHSRWKRGELIDYRDTEQTLRYRIEMSEINARLASGRIEYSGPDPVDLNRRSLHRGFTRESFESGGRLFGGFWQPMRKQDRLRHLQIDGEPVVELDYGQIMPRLVYALAGATPPQGDLYSIPGFQDPSHRPGIKKVTASMLFSETILERFPQGTRKYFPRDVHIDDVTDAIMDTHPDINDYFFTGIGHRCQFLESQILVQVLLTLGNMGITVLPIHDAVIVPASAVAKAKAVMLDTFKEMTGQDGVVDILTMDGFKKEEEELQLVA